MDSTETACGAFEEAIAFLRYFKDLVDPRQQGKVTYPLDEILLLCLLGVMAGSDTFVDIALFGTKSWHSCAGFVRSKAARLPTITSATSWPFSMPTSSSAVSLPGSAR